MLVAYFIRLSFCSFIAEYVTFLEAVDIWQYQSIWTLVKNAVL